MSTTLESKKTVQEKDYEKESKDKTRPRKKNSCIQRNRAFPGNHTQGPTL